MLSTLDVVSDPQSASRCGRQDSDSVGARSTLSTMFNMPAAEVPEQDTDTATDEQPPCPPLAAAGGGGAENEIMVMSLEPSPPARSPSHNGGRHASPRGFGSPPSLRRPIQQSPARSFVASTRGEASTPDLAPLHAPPQTVGCHGTPPLRPLRGRTGASQHTLSAVTPPPGQLEPLSGAPRAFGNRSLSRFPAPLPLTSAGESHGDNRHLMLDAPSDATGSLFLGSYSATNGSAIVPVVAPPSQSSPSGSAFAFARAEHATSPSSVATGAAESPTALRTQGSLPGETDNSSIPAIAREGSDLLSASTSLTPRSKRRSQRSARMASSPSMRPGAGENAGGAPGPMGASTSASGSMPSRSPQRQIAGLMTPLGGSSANSSFNCYTRGGSPMPSLGMRQYTVDRRKPLGSGASGTVYSGFDTIRGDHVAVKMSHVGGAAIEQASAEFEAEFRTLTQLAHENIVGVRHLELVPEKGEAAIVMEWVPGGSIATVLERQRFRLHELVVRRYLREALLGVEYLHANGVLHRDLKPANLLLAGGGGVKVSDFGTSRILGGDAGGGGAAAVNATHNTKAVVGTPAYMAPELISAGKCSKAVDIWALAATAVEMLSGKAPWSHLPRHKRQPVPLMFHIGMAQPPDHHPRIPPHVSPPLRALLERCFSFKPRKRPSATELLEDTYFSFEQVVRAAEMSAANGEPVALPPVSPDALAAELGMEDIGEYADARQEHEDRELGDSTACTDDDAGDDDDESSSDDF